MNYLSWEHVIIMETSNTIASAPFEAPNVIWNLKIALLIQARNYVDFRMPRVIFFNIADIQQENLRALVDKAILTKSGKFHFLTPLCYNAIRSSSTSSWAEIDISSDISFDFFRILDPSCVGWKGVIKPSFQTPEKLFSMTRGPFAEFT